MISNTDIREIISNYDTEDIHIGVLASHSALQILYGAKKEGLKTILISIPEREVFYNNFPHLIDKTLVVDRWKDLCKDDVVRKLQELNTILVPHGSMVEYIGSECFLNLELPLFGSRKIMEVEADPKKKMNLLRSAGIPVPREYSLDENFDDLVIVKLPGAKGGRGYFIAKGKEEVMKKLNNNVKDVIIQEYLLGVRAYYHYFYSPVLRRLEILGMDIRYESNADSLGRVPREYIEPTFTVVGNIPLVLRESLLPKVMEYGNRFVNATLTVENGGIAGPFCLESIVKENLSIVVFEFSGRIVAGTNIYVNGSPYSWLYWDEPMSMGRRIAREVILARQKNELNKILR